MARQWRVEYPDAVHHITTRGVARGDLFFSDADKLAFLSRLPEVCERWGLVVRGYCLMTNHYPLGSSAEFMGEIGLGEAVTPAPGPG
ncbi:MAG: hypothetical protein GW911_24330 [Armatimonadetes bacterium]|nr:hypothetical protein [Armatimonadota bacterium]NCP32933.1 hypothetical protein [Armatimonadota bacterium]NDK15172.1 hypothetical protein [Armatimonadota bacterium]PIU89726.1 MAG: hypothetical protein COS65_27730 [Armatimonadetes bacterium CG06_land_8_20_14_3_00_66_21]PJB68786.1 MAG: hypothetical protein CO096_14280 [Armatimonadetes bacterium CG_4_9_14_3_um_filter_66_14]